jgi:hypothetical protein
VVSIVCDSVFSLAGGRAAPAQVRTPHAGGRHQRYLHDTNPYSYNASSPRPIVEERRLRGRPPDVRRRAKNPPTACRRTGYPGASVRDRLSTPLLKHINAEALYNDDGATLDDLREAVTTLEDATRIARRVLGGAHPTAVAIEANLQKARAALRAHRNVELRAAVKEDPSSLSADDLARAEQLMARDARKAAQKKAARGGDSGSR